MENLGVSCRDFVFKLRKRKFSWHQLDFVEMWLRGHVILKGIYKILHVICRKLFFPLTVLKAGKRKLTKVIPK